MDKETKLKILQELDSTTDWGALVEQHEKTWKAGTTTKPQATVRKLTKSEKKRVKLEKQRQQVEAKLKTKNIETVVYNNPDVGTSAKSNKSSKADPTIGNEPKGIQIDMNKARHEIVKFGIQSLSAKALEDAEAALAMSLGAKPNKRQAVNYKELQIQRKKEKMQAKEQERTMMKPKLKNNMKKKQGSMKQGKRSREQPKGGRISGRNSRKPGGRKRNH